MLHPSFDELPPDAFLRLRAVMAMSSLGRSTIYDQIQQGRFPRSEKLTAHASGWRVRDIKAWLANPGNWRADRQPCTRP